MSQFFFKLFFKFKILKFFNLKSNITLNGKIFIVPLIGDNGYSNLHISELWMISILKILLPQKKGSFVDVGVNIGQTLLKLKSVDNSRPYFGFEPNSFCVHYSSELIKLNNFRNAKLFPFGVSNKNAIGVLNFYRSGDSDSSASMISDFRPDQRIEKRTYIPLYAELAFSEFMGDDKIGFLKIDVEGAELEVLESFKAKIAKDKPMILIEILPVYSKDNISRLERQNNIESMLKEEKYRVFRLIKSENKVFNLQAADSIGVHSDVSASDYICVHESDLGIIRSIQF